MDPGFPHGTSPWAKGPRESGGELPIAYSSAIFTIDDAARLLAACRPARVAADRVQPSRHRQAAAALARTGACSGCAGDLGAWRRSATVHLLEQDRQLHQLLRSVA